MHHHVIAITQLSVHHSHAMLQPYWLDRSGLALNLGEIEACETNPDLPIWQRILRRSSKKAAERTQICQKGSGFWLSTPG